MNSFRVFRKGSYEFKPFQLEAKTLAGTVEATLSEYGSKEDLSCGMFRMKNNGFELTYPNDEVMLVVAGEVQIVAGEDTLTLTAGDIIQVKEGLRAEVRTKSSVEIFFVGYPVKAFRQPEKKERTS